MIVKKIIQTHILKFYLKRQCVFFALLGCLVSLGAYSSDADNSRVLVMLKGSDSSDSDLEKVFNQEAEYASNIYKSMGFKVIELSDKDGTLTTAGLQTTLADLKSVKEVHMLLLAHGIGDKSKKFNLQAKAGNISGMDFKDAIQKIIKNNPEVKIYLPSLSCYSGALGHQLADVPGVLTLPGSGWDRPVYLDDNFNHMKNFLSSISKNENYFSAEQATWQAQFDFAISTSASITLAKTAAEGEGSSLPLPLRRLPLLRTQAELFLEAWCDSNKNGDISSSKSLCIQNNLSSTKEMPEEMKGILLQEFKNTNQAHLDQIQKLFDKLECNSGSRATPFLKFDILRTEVINQFIDQLTSDVKNITPEKYKKNQIASLEEYQKMQEANMIPGMTKEQFSEATNQISNMSLQMIDSAKENGLNVLNKFKDQCLKSNFDPGKSFHLEGIPTGDCRMFITYVLKNMVEQFSVEKLSNPSIKTEAPLYLPSDASTKSIFQIYARKLSENIKSGPKGDTIYFDDFSRFNIFEIPKLVDFCKLVEGSISELEENNSCVQSFKNSAVTPDWLRYLDIYDLSHRTLSKESGQ